MQLKDPEGLFGSPNTGHIARLEFKRRLEKDADAREAFQRHVLEEKERRQALRQVRINGSSVMYVHALVSDFFFYFYFYFFNI